jgi:hypothetical protein
MAVKTSPFTGWRLSGRDADAFSKQVNESRPNERAQESLMRGRALCKQMEDKGYSSVNQNKATIFKKACRYIKKRLKIK